MKKVIFVVLGLIGLYILDLGYEADGGPMLIILGGLMVIYCFAQLIRRNPKSDQNQQSKVV